MRQAAPTHGNLPADIAVHLRFQNRTKCFATFKFAFIGAPYPLRQSQLITLIEHYGGQYVPLRSVDKTTTFLILGEDPDGSVLKRAFNYKITIGNQESLFGNIGGRPKIRASHKRRTDVDNSLQQPSSKRQRV